MKMTKVSQKVSQHEDDDGLSEGLSAHRTSSAKLSHLQVTAASWSGREAMAQVVSRMPLHGRRYTDTISSSSSDRQSLWVNDNYLHGTDSVDASPDCLC